MALLQQKGFNAHKHKIIFPASISLKETSKQIYQFIRYAVLAFILGLLRHPIYVCLLQPASTNVCHKPGRTQEIATTASTPHCIITANNKNELKLLNPIYRHPSEERSSAKLVQC